MILGLDLVRVQMFVTSSPSFTKGAFQLMHDSSNIFHHAMEKGPKTRLRDLCCKKKQKAHLSVHLMILTPEELHLLLDLHHITA